MEKPDDTETTRYKALPKLLKVVFLIFSISGVGLFIFHVLGFNIRGFVFLSTAYYLLLIAAYTTCIFLILPARKKDKGVQWYDLVAAALAFGIAIYFYSNAWEICQIGIGWAIPTPFNFALALVFCLLVLEGGRRAAGLSYLIVCIVLGLYPLYADHMPGILYGYSYSLPRMIGAYTFGADGILGLPTRVTGDILIGFLLFAGILMASGAGDFLLNLAIGLLGKFRGGPAKAAVLGSGFFGSLSGNVSANIVATGSVTIPAMKRLGYAPHYAAAIEAVASTGGMIMPPVMGVVAFIMAEIIGVSYAVIMISAAIPATLYYFGLLMQVDAYSVRTGLKGLPREEIPPLKRTIKKGWPFITVLIFLVWGLLYMRWGEITPIYASGLMFLLSFTNRETMMTPKRIIDAFIIIGKLITQVVAILLPIAFIIAGLCITGASASVTAGLVHVGGGNIFLILLVGMLACYVLGMVGLGVVAYIFLAVTLAPALVEATGMNVLAVHLFIMYGTLMAGITPPVALAAFVAAPIAGASPYKVCLTAMRLGIALYIIPFFFLFNPALVLQGPILESLYLFALCLLGFLLIAGGMEGYLLKIGKLELWTRPPLVIAGILIAFPGWWSTIGGAALALLTLAIILIGKKAAAEKLRTNE